MSADRPDYSKSSMQGFISCKQCVNYETSLFAQPCNGCLIENFEYDAKAHQWKRKGVINAEKM